MKCEEADKCTGAMVTSDIRSLAEQTAAGMISVQTELFNYVSCVTIKCEAIGFHSCRRWLVLVLPAWRCLNELFCSAQWWHCFLFDHTSSALTPKKWTGTDLAEIVTLPYYSKQNKICQKDFNFSLSLMENTQFTMHDMVEVKQSSGILETWVIPVSGIANIVWYWLQLAWSNHEPKAEQVPGAGPAELWLHPRMEISQLPWAPVPCLPKLWSTIPWGTFVD